MVPSNPRRRRTTNGSVARTSPKKTTLVLIDDHALFREGLRRLIECEDDLVVIGEASDGREGVALVARLLPDVIVMDVAMKTLNGIEATRQIVATVPTARILILSAYSDDEYVDQVTRLGAVGYILKTASFDDLAVAIRQVTAGKRFFSPVIARRMLRRTDRIIDDPVTPLARLTPRESEVLQLVAEGLATKQIARELGISIKTAEKHRQSLMDKLDVHDVAGLTRYAIATGSIEGRKQGSTPDRKGGSGR